MLVSGAGEPTEGSAIAALASLVERVRVVRIASMADQPILAEIKILTLSSLGHNGQARPLVVSGHTP